MNSTLNNSRLLAVFSVTGIIAVILFWIASILRYVDNPFNSNFYNFVFVITMIEFVLLHLSNEKQNRNIKNNIIAFLVCVFAMIVLEIILQVKIYNTTEKYLIELTDGAKVCHDMTCYIKISSSQIYSYHNLGWMYMAIGYIFIAFTTLWSLGQKSPIKDIYKSKRVTVIQYKPQP